MATLKQRLHRKNASGTYDTVHFESTSDLILRPSGRTVEQDLADYLPEVQNNDNVPESLPFGTSKSFLLGVYGTFLGRKAPKNTPSVSQKCTRMVIFDFNTIKRVSLFFNSILNNIRNVIDNSRSYISEWNLVRTIGVI